MYDPILLTLDGSELAEAATPHAAALAKAGNARLLVVRVVPPVVTPMEADMAMSTAYTSEALINAEMSAAQEYIDKVVAGLKAEGLQVEAECPLGEPSSTILDYAEQKGAKIIVMATHGRSGFSRLVFGSVADRVLRESGVPVLLVQIHEPEKND